MASTDIAIGQQLLGRDLEELVARVRLQQLQQVLAVVARRLEPGRVEHLAHLAAQHRHPQHALGVGRRREQPEEPALPGDRAGGVEGLDARRSRGRPDGGPSSGSSPRSARAASAPAPWPVPPAGSLSKELEIRWSARRMPRPVPWRGDEDVLAVDLGEGVLADAEEGEVVVDEPLEQLARLGDLVGGHAGRRVARSGTPRRPQRPRASWPSPRRPRARRTAPGAARPRSRRAPPGR